MQEIMRQDKFLRRMHSIRIGLFEPRGIVAMLSMLIILIVVLLHIIDPLLGWVAAFILQIILLLSNVFVLVVFMEYQERTGYDAADVERLVNPVRIADYAIRLVQALMLLVLGGYIIAPLCCGPFLVWDAFLSKATRIDSTRLWKEINSRLTECKFKLAGNIAGFFAVLAAMVFALVGNWFA